jgi:hypothetical protein
MGSMDRFDDVSVVASVDESPASPRVPRGMRRAFTVAVASVVVTGALAGAAVGLADEKAEPSKSATDASQSFMKDKRGKCRKGERHQRSSESAFRY